MKKCKHINKEMSNIISGGYNIPDGMIEEYDIVCKDCKEVLGHWAYGSYDIDYMIKYELKGIKKLKVIFELFKIKIKVKFELLRMKIKGSD